MIIYITVAIDQVEEDACLPDIARHVQAVVASAYPFNDVVVDASDVEVG